MNERELEAEQAAPRNGVDDRRAGSCELVECREQVVGLERDVVHPRAAPGEEPTDGRVLSRGCDQLEPAPAYQQRCSLDALIDDLLPPLDASAEERRVRRDRLVEVGDGDAEVMDAAHAGDATRASFANPRAQSRIGSARIIPIVSDDRDSGTTSARSAWSSERSSVSFSSSA